MTYINKRYQENARDMLLYALSNMDTACEYMNHIIRDNLDADPADSYTLRMIDNRDILDIYTRQIKLIVKEM